LTSPNPFSTLLQRFACARLSRRGGRHRDAAAKAATATIPIVFSSGADPVQVGLVASLNRPGGNLTGISYMNVELGAKRVGILHELLPDAARFAMLVDPNSPLTPAIVADVQAAASTIGRQIEVLSAGTNRDIDTVFAGLAQKRLAALLLNPMPLFCDRRIQILTLAARYAMPTIYPAREWAEAGGMMSYGSSFADQFRQTGIYTGRILKGEKPADRCCGPPSSSLLSIYKRLRRLALTCRQRCSPAPTR
jgi:ABC-type uncharacterized transport system substrate-binding protein